jgi:epoxyqueuosine reductase
MKVEPAEILLELYEQDQEKYFDDPAGVPLFDPPMVAVGSADDPWFARFKETIGEFHWTPQEALALGAPEAQARSVICWALPVAEVARETNRAQKQEPSRPWAYVRTFGEQFNTRLRHGMEGRLRELGYAALAPAVAPENKTDHYPGIGFACCWSERHVAFVAGLGTFGLSGGLITLRGVAQRFGSVVTDAEIDPTPRPYGDDPFAWCLRTAPNTCGACISRCPAGSVGETVEGRDKDACREHTYGRVIPRAEELYGWKGAYGCGLCQTATPCESRNPTADS